MDSEAKRQALLDAVARHPEGISLSDIETALGGHVGRRSIQYHLGALVRADRIERRGDRRWTLYFPRNARTAPVGSADAPAAPSPVDIPLTPAARRTLAYLERPSAVREPAFHRAAFRAGYRPNVDGWLSEVERERLHRLGDVVGRPEPAGTYARRVLDRLLIDLAWNSSRLEGNTYSLLDTRRLIAFGIEADGGNPLEAQMIRNHRDAIEFLVENAAETGFDRRTVMNLHALLANELLPDPLSPGRLRRMAVGIGGSTYRPLDTPTLIESEFDALLEMLSSVEDAFEQALLTLAHLPYLQPFDDVNKRVSRLAANIPLIRRNLVPISFVDVPRELYVKALLGVYESNDTALLKELFLWAYERSASNCAEVRQSLGSPDPFRLRHRESMVALVGDVVRRQLGLRDVSRHVRDWTDEHVAAADRARFADMVESELLNLNDGNFTRFRLRPSEFDAWNARRGAARETLGGVTGERSMTDEESRDDALD